MTVKMRILQSDKGCNSSAHKVHVSETIGNFLFKMQQKMRSPTFLPNEKSVKESEAFN